MKLRKYSINLFLSILFILSLYGCAQVGYEIKGTGPEAEVQLVEKLRGDLDQDVNTWKESIDDPYAKDKLRGSYQRLQDKCREFSTRKEGFVSAREKNLCDITKYPFDIYFNELYIERHQLKRQLFDIKTPGTAANDYYEHPSKANLDKLKKLFEQVHKYYVGKPYTWYRYYNKFLFSKSRLEHFKGEFDKRAKEHQEAVENEKNLFKRVFAENRAEHAYKRLKDDCRYNNLAWCCAVNAFYLSHDYDGYDAKVKEQEKYAEERKRAGRKKEVVIFIHGLGGDRSSWGKFPELLAHEDIADPSMDRYFKVYVFRYDTIEDAKSVEGFRRELGGFINDIIKIEDVSSINLIGHSFGGVTSLKYLVQYLDDDFKDLADKDPEVKAETLVEGYIGNGYKRPLKRFIGMAPSFSGSEMANIMADWFKKEPPLYQKDLPMFRSGIPHVGDVQVMENQIGSMVNLNSFKRLDYERPLDPAYLVNFLNKSDRSAVTQADMKKLDDLEVDVLTVIGNPFNFLAPVKKPEDDGLVKCYSANLNHVYLKDAEGKDDIGYKKAKVRYINNKHNEMILVGDRNRKEFRYVVSFLSDKLIPQDDPESFTAKNFLVVARVHPDYIDINKNPDMCFKQEDKIYYTETERFEVPKLNMGYLSAADYGKDRLRSRNAVVTRASTNKDSGVFFFEGHVDDTREPGYAVFEMKANGFKKKCVVLKVEGGKVTYVPNLTLTPQGGEK